MDKCIIKSDIEKDVKEKADKILYRRGQDMAKFLRTSVYDLVEEYERIEAGKTQFDPNAIHGVAS